MSEDAPTPPILATSIPMRTTPSVYPEPFASRMAGRTKSQLGNHFGINNFGVNLTRLEPGAQSALLHRHTTQDEFIYVLQGTPTLRTDTGETTLSPGMCAGFPAGGEAHQLVNNTQELVVYLEVGDRTTGDQVTYPEDDLRAVMSPAGSWEFTRKDGSGY